MTHDTTNTRDERDTLDRMIDAMLDMVAAGGWSAVTCDAVTAQADVTPADAAAVCGNRSELLDAYARRVDAVACADAQAGADDEARYDELLDILMRRFEVLQLHRDAVVRLVREVPADPCTVLRCLPQSQRSFGGLAGAAGYPERGMRGAVLAKALSAVWLVTQRDWLRDDTPDLSVTMASLDRNLRRAIDLLGPAVGRADNIDKRDARNG